MTDYLHLVHACRVKKDSYQVQQIQVYYSSSSYLPQASLCLGQTVTEKVDLFGRHHCATIKAIFLLFKLDMHTKVDLQIVQRACGVMDIILFMLLSA